MEKEFKIDETNNYSTKPNESDYEGNIESIKEASRQADWVLFSLHAHEGQLNDRMRPADFIEDFARASIDNGAHCLIGHGPHVLRGIEIRDKKPIFYSLGNFVYQNMTLEKVPAEFYEKFSLDPYSGTPGDSFDAREKNHHAFVGEHAFERWISILPAMEFENDKLTELKIYPIEIGREKPRSQRGRPMIAKNNLATKILEIIGERSHPYGTEISVKENVGYVEV